MHVLLIPVGYPNSYNPQSHIFFQEQAHALSTQGLTVGVLAIVPISLKKIWAQKRIAIGFTQELNNGVQVFRYQLPSIPKLRRFNSWLQTKIGKRLYLKYRNNFGKPDIAHVHVSLAGNVAVWMNQTFLIPYIVTEHYTAFTEGNMAPWQKDLAKNVFSHSKKNIAVSNIFSARLEHDFNLKFEYIPNIVDTDIFVPSPQRCSKIPIRNFLNIGNLYKQKNQEMLIKAFSKSFKGKTEYRLIIAGSGTECSRLKKCVLDLSMQKQISFFGQADRKQVVKLMQDSDCFVLSSRYETFGVVVIEAMSCGLPVISTRSGGPESIITDESLGVLCDIDETQLCEALKEASKNRYDSGYIRRYAVANFSSDIIASRLQGLYLQILDEEP